MQNILRITLFTLSIFTLYLTEAQDTIKVQSLVYSSNTRDTMVNFPSGDDTYEKILMKYSMRCHGARVSTGSQRNLGCGEWDYSCNTYIVDSSRIDSLLTYTSDYGISNFSGSTYNYSTAPIYDYYRKQLKSVTVVNSANTNRLTVGSADVTSRIAIPLPSNPVEGISGKAIYLFTAEELLSAGLTAGEIKGITLSAVSTRLINGLRIRANSADQKDLSIEPSMGDFKEVYLSNTSFSIGQNDLIFHTPISWDGTSSVLLEFSLDQDNPGDALVLEGHQVDTNRGISAYGGRYFHLDGSTYIEANDYQGVLGSQNRSMSAWIRTSSPNGEIISYGRNAAGEKWVFRVNGDGSIRVEVNGGNIVGTTNLMDNKWHYVACVMDGPSVNNIKLYVDGKLESTTELNNRSINTTSNVKVRVSLGVNNRHFPGDVDNIKIWDRALSSTEVLNDMYFSPDLNDASLQLYYDFNSVTSQSSNIIDQSSNGRDASTFGNLNTRELRSFAIHRDFNEASFRPMTGFLTGDYTLEIDTIVSFDSAQQIANTVRKFQITSNTNTIFSDEITTESINKYWNADNESVLIDEDGNQYSSRINSANGSIEINQLSYYRRWPSRLEIISFVTPYGIGLDLGPDGVSWLFDVTHFAPILKGNKRMYLSRGGQNQEEMDIAFHFIRGTPAREVLDIRQIWPTEQYQPNYTQIQDDPRFFPEVKFPVSSEAKHVEVRSAITGHGQQGEFIPRNHTISVDDTTYTRNVWKECASNPVYPQGGTWIYDRAGWCPGMATDVAIYDISDRATAGEEVSLDYNVTDGSGDSRYIINNQIVTYGVYNHNLDAAIEDIIEPSDKIAHGRFNPMCINPKMLVRNTGKQRITSMTIDYWVNDKANKRTFTWPGNVSSNEVETVYFPIDDGIWSSMDVNNPVFTAEIVSINGVSDDYSANNIYHSTFERPEFYPQDLVLFYRTNSAALETSVKLTDEWGTVLFERENHQPNTLYRDTLKLGIGCKNLVINDTDGDGISFWANNDGSGFFRIFAVGGGIVHTIEPDFGNESTLNFTVLHALNVPETPNDWGYHLYPNPTSGQITIEGADLFQAECTVLNAMGQQIDIIQHNLGDKIKVEMKDKAPGVYFVQVLRYGTQWTQKVIVR